MNNHILFRVTLLLISIFIFTGCHTWRPVKLHDNTPVSWCSSAPKELQRIKTVKELKNAYHQGKIPDFWGDSCVFWLNSLTGMQALLEEGAPTGNGCLENAIDFLPRPNRFEGTLEDTYALFIHYGLSPTEGSRFRLPPVFSLRYEVVEWALKNGADPNTIARAYGIYTPLNHLHRAICLPEGTQERQNIAKLLLSYGADVNLCTDYIQETPISLASKEEFNSQYERQQWINLYLKYGAKKADIRPQIKRDVESIYFKSSP